MGSRVRARRVEVGDEEDAAGWAGRVGHARIFAAARLDRLLVCVVHPVEEARPVPLGLGSAPARARPSPGGRRAHVDDLAAAGRATAPHVALRREEPGAVGNDGANAGVVRRDHGQPGRHRLDEDDAERLRRLGREQEEVGGAKDVRQLGVRDGAEEMNALGDSALAGPVAEVLDQLASARDDDVDALVAQLRERVDRDVEPLEVVGAIEGRDERGDDRVGRDAEALAQAASVLAGAEALGVHSVRHLDQLRRVPLARARAGRRPSRRGRG